MEYKTFEELNKQKSGMIEEICRMILDSKTTMVYLGYVTCNNVTYADIIRVNDAISGEARIKNLSGDSFEWRNLNYLPIEHIAKIKDEIETYKDTPLFDKINDIQSLPLKEMVEWINGHIDKLADGMRTSDYVIYRTDDTSRWQGMIERLGISEFIKRVADKKEITRFSPDAPYYRIINDRWLISYSYVDELWDDYSFMITSYLKRLYRTSEVIKEVLARILQ